MEHNCSIVKIGLLFIVLSTIVIEGIAAPERTRNGNYTDQKSLSAEDFGWSGRFDLEGLSPFYEDEETWTETEEGLSKEENLEDKDKDTLSYLFPNIRAFSLSGLMESVYTIVTSGISTIVNNIVGSESKSVKSPGSRVSYKGHQLLRIIPSNDKQVLDLEELRDNEVEDLKFWTQPAKNRTTDIVVSPEIIQDMKNFLKSQKYDFKVLISDLQKTISYQNPKLSKEQREDLVSTQGHSMTWKRYHRYGDILRYLEYLAFRYPSLVELVTIGHSFEGQPLKLAKVSTGPTKDGDTKPTIWIDAGMHAREWIGSAVATYILSQLVEKNSTYAKLLESSDWMILPVVNPDGYEFSHTGDRLWRKTRSNHADNDGEARHTPAGIFHLVSHYTKWFFARCDGVDPNRNFGYHWGEEKSGAASTDPCHETYAGPHSFSEPETRAMADYILANRQNIKMYLTLHSYSQMWLVPWGYTKSRPSDFSELANVARKAVNAIAKVHGTRYQVGASPDLLYPTSGGSDDWAKGVAGIKYSYTVELRDRGTYGFLLPATQIVPTARETWAGIRAIARLITCNS
ncbi:carboxypeptidase B [Cephus cinctus]|uniref:Carboxypeptidase B n=1 Tax=Cephus cinctus TaxID=211228 RepID=A0AAJ7CG73_CEPCN|nr:carboxypeptidase B [Cephus cinctus]